MKKLVNFEDANQSLSNQVRVFDEILEKNFDVMPAREQRDALKVQILLNGKKCTYNYQMGKSEKNDFFEKR